MKFKINSKFNIKINSKLNKTHMIFTRFRDIDQDRLFPTVPVASSSPSEQMETKLKKMNDKEEEEEATTILRGSYNGLVGCFVRLTEGLTW